MDIFINPVTVSIALVVIAALVLFASIKSRYRIANPDEAIIVTGRRGKTIVDEEGKSTTDLSGQKVVTGSGVFVLPFVQQAFVLELRSRRLNIQTTAQTKNGITIQAEAVAVIKVGGSEEMIRAAAQRFLSQQDEIESSTKEVLSGSLRGIIGTLTVMDIIQDRQALATAVLSAAEEALFKQGLVVDTLQIQNITDANNYISDLGRPEAAAVRQAAEVADTIAARTAKEASIKAEQELVEKQRELDLKRAEVRAETDKALARAEAAKPLEEATQRQAVVAQEEITAQREAALREQRLIAEVNKPADAEAYRLRVQSEAEADATVRRAEAEAKSVRERGIATADTARAQALAEADGIKARGEALQVQSEAVLAQQALEQLPALAEALAKSYSGIDNLTIISADGPQKLVGDVTANLAATQQALKDATGIDLGALINTRVQGKALGAGIGDARAGDSLSEG